VAALFMVMMFYAWQHFSSIEYGYRLKRRRPSATPGGSESHAHAGSGFIARSGQNRCAGRKMGLESTQPGQVIRLNPEDVGAPIMAQATTVAVITAQ
jgi:hypothetical protein